MEWNFVGKIVFQWINTYGSRFVMVSQLTPSRKQNQTEIETRKERLQHLSYRVLLRLLINLNFVD